LRAHAEGRQVLFREVHANCWDPKRRLAECDGHGVDVQVLSTVPIMFSYWARPADALDLSRLLNEHIAGVAVERPERFVGLGTVPMQSAGSRRARARALRPRTRPRRYRDRLARQRHEPRSPRPVPGVRGRARSRRRRVRPSLGDARPRPHVQVLAAVAGGHAGRDFAVDLLDDLRRRVRAPAGLRVLFAHGGGAFPATLGRIEHGFSVRPDLVAVDNDKNPRDYLGRFYVDSLVHDPDMLRFMIKLMGAERIALGSDYPFPLGETVPGA
jgi:aminocarboxymuconate-semialdehyde decarboxylase